MTATVGPAEVERALAAAFAARRACAEVPRGRRAEILLTVAARLRAEEAAFADLVVEEAAKPVDLARAEVRRAAATFEAAAYVAGSAVGEVRALDFAPAYDDRVALTTRVPIGVVAAITPFNFPVNLVAHKLAPAVAAGCPLLIKPAPATPRSAARLAKLVLDAGWPAEGLHVLPLADDAHAAPLIRDPRVRLLTFTGSAEVGWRLRDQAREKAVALELGGDAFVVVHADADVARAAARCAFGAFVYAGQTCISVQHVLVHRSILAPFRDAFAAEVRALPTGDPRTPGVVVGPVLRDRDADRIDAWCAEARRGGARTIVEGGRDGRFLEPRVFEDLPPTCALATQEAFGPVADLSGYDALDEAAARVNASRFGLQAGVFTRDVEIVRRLFRELEIGGLVYNEVPTLRYDAMPYGGVKGSGLGREGPAGAYEAMTEARVLVL
ncbi:MAG TPA: aldehyde dehydrogenase family protein [Planctomycetota bacterium]|nr:aldehyde dehydrogenase family protein [Planctomycetota bacterium]